MLQQIDYPHCANIRLRRVGVVMGNGLDVIAANRNRHLCAVPLVDVVDAYLAQFIRPLLTSETKRPQAPIEVVKRLVRDIKAIKPTIVIKPLPNGLVNRPENPPPSSSTFLSTKFSFVNRITSPFRMANSSIIVAANQCSPVSLPYQCLTLARTSAHGRK